MKFNDDKTDQNAERHITNKDVDSKQDMVKLTSLKENCEQLAGHVLNVCKQNNSDLLSRNDGHKKSNNFCGKENCIAQQVKSSNASMQHDSVFQSQNERVKRSTSKFVPMKESLKTQDENVLASNKLNITSAQFRDESCKLPMNSHATNEILYNNLKENCGVAIDQSIKEVEVCNIENKRHQFEVSENQKMDTSIASVESLSNSQKASLLKPLKGRFFKIKHDINVSRVSESANTSLELYNFHSDDELPQKASASITKMKKSVIGKSSMQEKVALSCNVNENIRTVLQGQQEGINRSGVSKNNVIDKSGIGNSQNDYKECNKETSMLYASKRSASNAFHVNINCTVSKINESSKNVCGNELDVAETTLTGNSNKISKINRVKENSLKHKNNKKAHEVKETKAFCSALSEYIEAGSDIVKQCSRLKKNPSRKQSSCDPCNEVDKNKATIKKLPNNVNCRKDLRIKNIETAKYKKKSIVEDYNQSKCLETANNEIKNYKKNQVNCEYSKENLIFSNTLAKMPSFDSVEKFELLVESSEKHAGHRKALGEKNIAADEYCKRKENNCVLKNSFFNPKADENSKNKQRFDDSKATKIFNGERYSKVPDVAKDQSLSKEKDAQKRTATPGCIEYYASEDVSLDR